MDILDFCVKLYGKRETKMLILHYSYSALVIFSVLLFSMLIRKVVKGYTNTMFFLVLLTSSFTTVCDIFAEWRIFSPFVRQIFNYGYFFGAILIPLFYSLYIYSSIGLLHYVRSHPKVWALLSAPLVVYSGILLANVFTHCAFYIDQEGIYQRGPFQPYLIVTILLYILEGSTIILKWKKIIAEDKIIALSSFFPIMLASFLVQQFNPGLEFNMFGLAVSQMIIAFSVQRKDEAYDVKTGMKSFECALEDFQKVFLTKQHVSVIYLKIKNQNAIKRYLGSTAYTRFVSSLCKELFECIKQYKHFTEVYYIHEEIYSFRVVTQDEEIVRTIANAINNRLKEPVHMKDIAIAVERTICIVRIPEDISNLESLMNFRLNFHKKLPETNEVHELKNYLNSKDFKIKNDLDAIVRNALQNNLLEMYYQPIYSIKDRKFISAEALLRLKDPVYGYVSPALFIPAAEATGTIHQIGDFVNDSVINFISRHNFKELGLEYVELNLSVNQCIENDLVPKIDRIMDKYHVSPDKLNFEITETAEGFDLDLLDRNINQLHSKGFSFSLDDYGTGYSNIKRLTELPLEIVKLDKSFVDQMNKPEMWTVIENTVHMFKKMNKTILVEGVEDEEKLFALASLGCDYIQGYYFSKPLPEKEFIQFIREHNNVA